MQWFKHNSNMRNNVKIKRLISKYGIEGYGLYNLIIEIIVEGINSNSPMPQLKETCSDMALFYNGNTEKITEIVYYMVDQELLEYDEIKNLVICHKIYKFLESSQTKSPEIRALISSYKQQKDEETLPQKSGNFRYKSEEKNRQDYNKQDNNTMEDHQKLEAFRIHYDSFKPKTALKYKQPKDNNLLDLLNNNSFEEIQNRLDFYFRNFQTDKHNVNHFVSCFESCTDKKKVIENEPDYIRAERERNK